jgi:hypothetical protein
MSLLRPLQTAPNCKWLQFFLLGLIVYVWPLIFISYQLTVTVYEYTYDYYSFYLYSPQFYSRTSNLSYLLQVR